MSDRCETCGFDAKQWYDSYNRATDEIQCLQAHVAKLETLLNEYKDAEFRAVKLHGEALARVAELEDNADIADHNEAFLFDKIEKLQAQVDELKALLRVAECPEFCEGVLVVSESYERPDGEIEYVLSRCQFCAERDALLENNDE
jgi:hypothetical protein